MAKFDLFPDAEKLISQVVRAATGGRVYSSIPKDATYPLITIKRLGGIPVHRSKLDAAELQIDSYGTGKKEARLQALNARIAIYDAEGTFLSHSGDTGWLTGVEDSLGLTWSPDSTNPPIDRYIIGVRVFMHV